MALGGSSELAPQAGPQPAAHLPLSLLLSFHAGFSHQHPSRCCGIFLLTRRESKTKLHKKVDSRKQEDP